MSENNENKSTGADVFSDLSLSGMEKYNERSAEAHRVKRAAELDERIREFASREKTPEWIREAPLFCEREELSNKDIFELSKEAHRLELIKSEAERLCALAKEEAENAKRREAEEAAAEEERRLKRIEAENREKLARMYAEAKAKAEAEALELKARTERETAEAKAKAEAERLELEARAAKEAAEARAKAEAERLEIEAKAAREKAEADARIAKAQAEAEEARLLREREAEAEKLRAEREARENEEKLRKIKAEAEEKALREKLAKEAKERENREAAEELDRFIDMLSAAPRTSSWDEEIEKTESKVKELPAEVKFLLKKLGVLEKMSAEAKELRREEAERLARIAAEEEKKRREEEERRKEQKRREEEARRIEAEKRKAEEERAEREKAEEYNREVLTLYGAEKTITWALRVQEVWDALNGKLSAYYVSNRYLLEDMISDAMAMINATDLDWEIEKLESGQKTLEWANKVSTLYYKIENGMNELYGIRIYYAAAKVHMRNFASLSAMYAEATKMQNKESDERAKAYKAEKRAKKRKERTDAVKAGIKAFGTSVAAVIKRTLSVYVFLAVIAVFLLIARPENYLVWIIPTLAAGALMAAGAFFKKLSNLSFVIHILALIGGGACVLVSVNDKTIAPIAVVLSLFVFISCAVNEITFCCDWRKHLALGYDDEYAVWHIFKSRTAKDFALMLISSALESVSLYMLFEGNLSWLAPGIALAVSILVITLIMWLVQETYHNPNSYDDAIIMLTILIPVACFLLAFSGNRAWVFAGLMAAGGYVLSNMIKLVVYIANGKSFSDCFDMSDYREGTGPVVAVTLVFALTLLMFFGYVGRTDYIVDKNGTLTACYYLGDTMVIPEGVTKIGDGAVNKMTQSFHASRMITKRVVIPEGVTEIGADVFLCSYGVKEIYLPKSLEKINGVIFVACPEKVTVYYAGDTIPDFLVGNKSAVGDGAIVNINPDNEPDFFSTGAEMNVCREIEWVTGYDYMDEFYGDSE